MISRIRRGIRRLQDCVRWKGFDVAAKLRRRAKMFKRLKCSWHGGEEYLDAGIECQSDKIDIIYEVIAFLPSLYPNR
jgi:hypothetical protein